ncbi:MAG TPA: type IV pilin protein [Burkholderiaceae bacterium]|nr:type IV pilin protein [Burkholderiaceae bacterium]
MQDRSTLGSADHQGFTLMEVIVTMMVIAILSAIAIPNYTAYVQRGYRSEAKSMLLAAAQWQQRFRTETNAYALAATGLPVGMDVVPATGAARYNVTIEDPPPVVGGFRLLATPVGAQAGDECGVFRVDHLGARSVVIATVPYTGGSAEVTRCWGR